MSAPAGEDRGVGASPDLARAGRTETQHAFSPTQIWLHWIIAALIFVQFWLNDAMEVAFGGRLDGGGKSLPLFAIVHMVVGATVLCLTTWRLGLRLRDGVPPPESDANFVIRVSSKLTHLALYVLAIGMPLTGMIAWLMKDDLLSEVHEFGSKVLIVVIVLHVLGAVFEHSIMGNDTLARMLRPGGEVARWRTGERARASAKSRPEERPQGKQNV